MANEPTFNPNAYPRCAENERRNRAVQDLYEPGSTFKIVTASAAIEEKVMDVDALIDTNPGAADGRTLARHHRRRRAATTACCRSRQVIVQSSNIGAVKIGLQRSARNALSRFVGLYGFGSQVSPDFPSENAGIVWSPDEVDRERARLGVDGLPDRRHAAADGRRGQRRSPTAADASSRVWCARVPQRRPLPGDAEGRPPKAISADTASTLTTIMEEVVTDGTAKRRRHRRLHDRRQDRHGAETDRRPVLAFRSLRVVRRLRAVARPGARDRCRHRLRQRVRTAITAAPSRRRSSRTLRKPALRYLGDPVEHQSAGAGARRPRRRSPRMTSTAAVSREAPVVSLIADGPPGTVPDLRGLSAREAVRKLVDARA